MYILYAYYRHFRHSLFIFAFFIPHSVIYFPKVVCYTYFGVACCHIFYAFRRLFYE